MIYSLDTNAFYEYFGREKLFEEKRKYIDSYKLCELFDKQLFLLLPSSVLIEIALRFRTNFKAWKEISAFIQTHQFLIVDTVSTHLVMKDWKALLDSSEDKFVSFTDIILDSKIAEEAGGIYFILVSIMLEFFSYSFREKAKDSNGIIPLLLFRKFVEVVQNDFTSEIKNVLLLGYRNGDVREATKRIFGKLLEEIYLHVQLILDRYTLGGDLPQITASDISTLFEQAKSQLATNHRGAKGIIQDKLKHDPYFTLHLYKPYMEKGLFSRNYTRLQVDYMITIIDAWLESRDKIKKNDFYDLHFLGILNKLDAISPFIKEKFPDLYNVLDCRIVAISFDNAVRTFLQSYHPISYHESSLFYK